MLTSAAAPARPQPKPIHHVLSLGANCYPAAYFKRAGYRTFAGPFDWLAADCVDVLADLLATDFAAFLDPAQLVDHACGSDGCAGHATYGDRFFHHYNPRQPEAAAYYSRCVDRFRRLGALGQPVLCLLVVDKNNVKGDVLERIHKGLGRVGANLVFVACVVEAHASARASTLVQVGQAPDQSFYRWDLAVLGHNVGVAFSHPGDDAFFHAALHSYFAFDIQPSPFLDKEEAWEKRTADGIHL
jgi:hypothetical protein